MSEISNKRKISTRRIWTDKERKILASMFPDNYTIEICKALNRSYSSVSSQANLMGLKKSDSFMKMELDKQADRLRVIGESGRYQKGSVPLNKGKPMPIEVYEKLKHTMFKKGKLPHNTNYDGHERITKDGYTEIRVKQGKYLLKHRVIWEQEKGAIPKGLILVFKDGNPRNITIDNLELMTRVENMQRNTIHRYPPELKSTIKLVHKLKRKINAKEQN